MEPLQHLRLFPSQWILHTQKTADCLQSVWPCQPILSLSQAELGLSLSWCTFIVVCMQWAGMCNDHVLVHVMKWVLQPSLASAWVWHANTFSFLSHYIMAFVHVPLTLCTCTQGTFYLSPWWPTISVCLPSATKHWWCLGKLRHKKVVWLSLGKRLVVFGLV